MLALAPDMVDMARAKASPAVEREIPGPLTPFDPASPNYSPSGSFGDPTVATRAKGELFLAVDDLIEQATALLARELASSGSRECAS